MRISVIGTNGVPARYGGFETLVENLIKFHDLNSLPYTLVVYCSSKSYPEKKTAYLTAQLKYIALKANGPSSILYDIVSVLSAIWNKSDVILWLGVSGSIALPVIRCLSSTRIITNIDGMEWRREKWRRWIRFLLRLSERAAVRFSSCVISDNAVIAEYVKLTYGVESHVIAYGGDHAVKVSRKSVVELKLPSRYAFSVCRIEPENNIHMIIEAFANLPECALVIVGNWNNSRYGKNIRKRYEAYSNLYLLDPIYDLAKLSTLRTYAEFYIHGHSAGGTNPSLVEAMHFGRPVLAYECGFNRNTTENSAMYFKDSGELRKLVLSIDFKSSKILGDAMLEIAQRRYTWKNVAAQYFSLIMGQLGGDKK